MDEISLREVLEIIIKRKWIIIVFTIVCTLISAFLSIFVLKPVYEAKSTFIISPIDIKSGINPSTSIIFDGDPNSIDIIKELDNKMLGSILNRVKYPQFDINYMINLMNSNVYIEKVLEESGIDIEKYDYKQNIKIGLNATSDIISVSVKYNDAKTALAVNKKLIAALPASISEKSNEQLKVTEGILDEGISRENKNLNDWEKRLSDFTTAVGGQDKLSSLATDKQGDYEEIMNNYILSNQALDSYQLARKEYDNIKAIGIEKMLNQQLISEDKEPLSPVSPKKSLNLAMATILGLMIGVFGVFFMEYWKNSAPGKKAA